MKVSLQPSLPSGGQRGQTLVDFAFAAMVILMLFFGIFEFGRALFTYDLVANAARIGTRYAMVHGSSCLSFASPEPGPPCTAYPTSAPASPSPYVTPVTSWVQYKSPGVNPSQLTVTTTWSSDCTFSSPLTTPTGNATCVRVQVSYPFKSLFPFVFPATMSSTSQVVVSQ
jgi:Flp pilus assembly protein TadG